MYKFIKLKESVLSADRIYEKGRGSIVLIVLRGRYKKEKIK